MAITQRPRVAAVGRTVWIDYLAFGKVGHSLCSHVDSWRESFAGAHV